jgi:UPF0755 protein
MSDGYQGWQDAPRGRRARDPYDQDYDDDQRAPAEAYGRGTGYGRSFEPGNGGYPAADPYPPNGYGTSAGYPGEDWTDEQDPYGRTDPHGGPPGYYQDPQPGYGQPDSYGIPPYEDHPSYPNSGRYRGPDPYTGQDPYSAPEAFSDQGGYRGQDAYRPDGYDSGQYGDVPEYGQDQAGYDTGGGYQAYGAPDISGPLHSYRDGGYDPTDNGGRGWRAGDGAGASRAGGEDYGPVPRRVRRASEYEQDDVGRDGPLGGSRRSGRGMDADDDRHSGFFAGYASNDDDHYGKTRRRGRGRSAGTIALVVVLVVVLGIGFEGFRLYSKYRSDHANWNDAGYGRVVVTVPNGASAFSIAPELVSKGVIAAAEPFVDAAKASSNPSGLQPGLFVLRKHMGASQAWALLLNPKARDQLAVTIPDGLRYSRILPILAKDSGIAVSKFQSAIKDTAALGLPSYANGSPEGYLYPATYDIQPGTTALQILQMAVHQFTVEASQLDLAAGAQQAQFTEAQVITEASLLEAEVGPKYYADVARVLDNRLNANMPLELDSTVAYATGDYSYNLSSSQLQVNSPYNTFIHAGLPPGPIDSPDAAAISAVLHPAPSSDDWLYFVTINKSGLTKFTSSQSQFEVWSSEAQRNGLG